MLLNLKLGLIMAGIAATLIVGAYFYGRLDGSSACDARHAAAQLEENERVKETYENIDKATPFNSDDAAIADFLLKHTSH